MTVMIEGLRLVDPLEVNRADLFAFERTTWYEEAVNSGVSCGNAIRLFDGVTTDMHSQLMVARGHDDETYFQVMQDDTDAIVALVDGDTADNYLRKLYVVSGMQSRGLGSRLLEEYESRAAEGPIGLSVLRGNLRAQAFYSRHGYRIVDPKPRWIGRGIQAIDMVKERGVAA